MGPEDRHPHRHGDSSQPQLFQSLPEARVPGITASSGLYPRILHINYPEAINKDFGPLFPNISWPPSAGTQHTGRERLTPPPDPEHPPGLPMLPTILHGQYSTEPRGGGPKSTPTQTTNTQSLAGHPTSPLSPVPTTTRRQTGSVKKK